MEMVKTRVMPAGDPQTIRRARRMLRSGKVIAFPTDTVYGVGADAFQPEAVAALYAVKNRPTNKAIPILVSQIEDIARVARTVPIAAWELVQRFWPGGLTLVLPRAKRVPPILTAGGSSVAIRCPDHPVPLDLMNTIGAPLATTSANLSGQASPTNARQVLTQLAGRVPLIIDGGECPEGVPSTILDLSVTPPRLLRVGAIAAADLQDVLPDLIG
jgi:L-threonylcarbamoyladenylate synthase